MKRVPVGDYVCSNNHDTMSIEHTLRAATRPIPPALIGDIGWETFWALQGLGWSAYFVVFYLGALADGEPPGIVWAALASAAAGLGLTSLMRPLLGPIWRLSPLAAAGRALLISFVFAIPFSVVGEQSYWLVLGEGWKFDEPLTLLHSAFWCGSILLTWTGIYFGVQYYRQAIQHREAALKAEAVAYEAQLARLRYQLNPHFLVNTLNGISTLVLTSRHDAAAGMLDRLSALLHESLYGNPREKATLDDELGLLKKYLEIEQIRFGDRMRVEYNIAPEARRAMLPYMILQPLVENAVKHAVAVMESGACIRITAGVSGENLMVCVADNGPGLLEKPTGENQIGLPNVSERLALLYGSRQRLKIGPDGPDGGVRVELELPLEYTA